MSTEYDIISYGEVGCHIHLLVMDCVRSPPLRKITNKSKAEYSVRDWVPSAPLHTMIQYSTV